MDDPGQRGGGFAVVDVETTGFVAEQERIIEVGVVVLDPRGIEVGAFCTLVDPDCDPGPTHIHGISSAMLSGAPTFNTVHPFLADLLSGRVVVGHNVDRFDLPFLRAECLRSGGEALVPGPLATVDTLLVAQHHLGLRGRATLVECCTRYGLLWADHHNALADARVTAALFTSMRGELGDVVMGIPERLDQAGGTVWPGASPTPPPGLVRAEALTS
ncbi:MAG TPA: 3'-5' exonuclease [Acidimicrobiales bacterium]|nr:3'-5' exonuclease [Acidimicrobiales bacterium]